MDVKFWLTEAKGEGFIRRKYKQSQRLSLG